MAASIGFPCKTALCAWHAGCSVTEARCLKHRFTRSSPDWRTRP
jgi:hypothetical protein